MIKQLLFGMILAAALAAEHHAVPHAIKVSGSGVPGVDGTYLQQGRGSWANPTSGRMMKSRAEVAVSGWDLDWGWTSSNDGWGISGNGGLGILFFSTGNRDLLYPPEFGQQVAECERLLENAVGAPQNTTGRSITALSGCEPGTWSDEELNPRSDSNPRWRVIGTQHISLADGTRTTRSGRELVEFTRSHYGIPACPPAGMRISHIWNTAGEQRTPSLPVTPTDSAPAASDPTYEIVD